MHFIIQFARFIWIGAALVLAAVLLMRAIRNQK